ncbi:hypothetical protein [Halanaeroarchaeum sp. HSR-CO]|uniref:hypothetical protein n=1 Tax=Halanaeroarchaeum sp. HSR-CO TaxID=2866382 RepID=UPI00217E356F|nr:hypothetical protein [Halanaeroarchaeum sp. HSR-CO]
MVTIWNDEIELAGTDAFVVDGETVPASDFLNTYTSGADAPTVIYTDSNDDGNFETSNYSDYGHGTGSVTFNTDSFTVSVEMDAVAEYQNVRARAFTIDTYYLDQYSQIKVDWKASFSSAATLNDTRAISLGYTPYSTGESISGLNKTGVGGWNRRIEETDISSTDTERYISLEAELESDDTFDNGATLEATIYEIKLLP